MNVAARFGRHPCQPEKLTVVERLTETGGFASWSQRTRQPTSAMHVVVTVLSSVVISMLEFSKSVAMNFLLQSCAGQLFVHVSDKK